MIDIFHRRKQLLKVKLIIINWTSIHKQIINLIAWWAKNLREIP